MDCAATVCLSGSELSEVGDVRKLDRLAGSDGNTVEVPGQVSDVMKGDKLVGYLARLMAEQMVYLMVENLVG